MKHIYITKHRDWIYTFVAESEEEAREQAVKQLGNKEYFIQKTRVYFDEECDCWRS